LMAGILILVTQQEYLVLSVLMLFHHYLAHILILYTVDGILLELKQGRGCYPSERKMHGRMMLLITISITVDLSIF